MVISNAFTSALADERAAAHAQYVLATSDAEREQALDRLADLEELAGRSLDRTLVA